MASGTRKYALRASGAVYVFTGPGIARGARTISPGKVWVPGHTWKVVYSQTDNRAWAYWLENRAGRQSLRPISYRAFVQRSGIDVLLGTSVD